MRKLLRFPAITLVVATISICASSSTNTSIVDRKERTETALTARSFSVVKVNPQTGELGYEPVAGEAGSLALAPQLENSLSRSAEGLQVTTGAGGGKMVDLRGRFRTFNVARQTDSGLTVECVDSKGGVQ